MRGKARAIALGLAAAGLVGGASLGQGGGTVLLPQLQKTARGLALGDGAIHIQGLNALGLNPATLSAPRPEAVFQFQQLSQDTAAGLLGLAYPLRPLGTTFGLSYLELRSTGFDRRDEFGTPSGTFLLDDRLIGFHASQPLPLGSELNPLDLGVGLKVLSSRIDSYHATAYAGDLGLRLALQSLPLQLGLAARNLGKGPTYVDQESKLPASYVLSAAYRPARPLTVTASAGRLTASQANEYSLGFEAWGSGPLTLRGRYAFATGGPDGTGIQDLAGGLGLNIHPDVSLDYAFQPFDSSLRGAGAVGTHRLTLTMRFKKAADGEDLGQEPEEASPRLADARLVNAPQGLSDYRIVDAPRDIWAGRPLGRRFDDVPTIRHAVPARDGDSDEDSSASGLLQRGYAALREGKFAIASLRLRQASDADPGNRALQALLPRLDRVGEVLPDAEGLEASLSYARAGVYRYVVGGDRRAAARELRRALNEDPANDSVLTLLNFIEREGGLAPTRRRAEHPGMDFVAESLQAARRATYDKRYAAALQRCQDALDVEPRNVRALSIMGTVYYLMQDLPRARATWMRAHRLDPDDQALSEALRRFAPR